MGVKMKKLLALLTLLVAATALLIGCSGGGSGDGDNDTTPTYTVTFDTNGTAFSMVKVLEGETVGKPADPTKPNYTFVGWYKDAAFATVWNFATDVVTKNTTLYAKWVLNTYAVTFEVDGGSAVAALPAVTHGTKIVVPTIPTKTGFTFGGWYKEATLTTAWDFAVDVVVAATTLYAKWTPATYTITFEVNGGSAVAPIANVAHGAMITKPADPTRTGHKFEGWHKEAALTTPWAFATDVVVAHTTLHAKWTDTTTAAGTFSVTFEVNGGSNVAKITNIKSGAKIAEPVKPTKSGFVFDGWYKTAALTTAWVFTSDVVTADITLYAKWALPNNLSVTFEVNGGSSVSKKTGISFGETITEPTAPTKTGSEFAGWFKDAEFTTAWDFETDVVESNITLYAKWVLNKYTVTFVSNGDTEVEPLVDVPYGTIITKPADPTKEFHSLVSWHTNESLSSSTVWNFTTGKVTGDMTLYAKWEIATYAMTFESNGGMAVTQITGIAHGAKVTEPNCPSKTGNMFKGWFKDEGLTNAWNFYDDVVTVNTKVYAKWVANVITNEGIVEINGKNVKTATINNIECMLVEKGFYFMGAGGTLGERKVTLTKNYWIGKYEIKQSEYRAVMDANPSEFQGNNRPVERVTWANADNFVAKAGGRLPTEAEWEFAARGGNYTEDYTYSGGNDISLLGWYRANSSETNDVGQKTPNELGIYDMSGNVYELCSDWYKSTYPTIPETDPQGPSSGNSGRVIRGGSYYTNISLPQYVDYLKVFIRNNNEGNASNQTGIRIVFPAE